MTNQTPIRLTAAETALVETYGRIFKDLPGDGAVVGARDRLIHDLRTRGLPTRRVEAWHYTDLKTLMKPLAANQPQADIKVATALVDGSSMLAVLNGAASGSLRLPGVSATTMAGTLLAGGQAALLAPRGADDAIGALNGAFVSDGHVIGVAQDTVLEAPVELSHRHAAGQFHSRSVIDAGASSKFTLIERHQSAGAGEALVSAVSHLTLDADADVTYVMLIEEGAGDTHLGQIRIRLDARAKLTLMVVNTGGKLVRQEIHVEVEGEGADFKLRGINLLGGDSHCDVTMTLGHNVPGTTSTEIIRNVVMDRAKGVFQGQIRVAQIAQQTDARMACNTLLLSDEAEFSTKPELEIFADDVQCAHGATVADIDHTQLFYLQARGIPENRARGLLVQAFVAEIVEELEIEGLVAPLEAIIETWLEAHA